MAKDSVPKVVVMPPVTSADGRRQRDYPLVDDRVTVGRPVPGYSPDIPLEPDTQSWISRLHCWFERVDGSWHVVDNGSVNGTMIERHGVREPVEGQRRVHDKDEVLILGYMVDDEPYWWRLRIVDPFATAGRPPTVPASSRPYLEYRLAEAKLLVVEGNRRTEIPHLGRNRHKLVRYMASRNAANGGTPVTCNHDELIRAVWGEPETWPVGKTRTKENLRDLVYELKNQLDPHRNLVETISGFGYLLRTQP